MSRFHINPEGNPGKCTAQAGGCPFGGDEAHYSSADDARKVYELQQALATIPSIAAKKVDDKEAKALAARGQLEGLFASLPTVASEPLTKEEQADARKKLAGLSAEERKVLIEEASMAVRRAYGKALPRDTYSRGSKSVSFVPEELDSYLKARRAYTALGEASGEFRTKWPRWHWPSGKLEKQEFLPGTVEENVARAHTHMETIKACAAAYTDDKSIKAVAKACGVQTASVREQLWYQMAQSAEVDGDHRGLRPLLKQTEESVVDSNPKFVTGISIEEKPGRSTRMVNAVGMTIAAYATAFLPKS